MWEWKSLLLLCYLNIYFQYLNKRCSPVLLDLTLFLNRVLALKRQFSLNLDWIKNRSTVHCCWIVLANSTKTKEINNITASANFRYSLVYQLLSSETSSRIYKCCEKWAKASERYSDGKLKLRNWSHNSYHRIKVWKNSQRWF